MNMLKGISNAFITAVEKQFQLPRFLIIILYDDVINFTDYDRKGVSTIFGKYIEFLACEITRLINDTKKSRPAKAVKESYPLVYWMALPQHQNFQNRDLRLKFNLCLESIICMMSGMHIIKMKEIWDYHNPLLVMDIGQLSQYGAIQYWIAMDAAIRYNAERFAGYGVKKTMNIAGTFLARRLFQRILYIKCSTDLKWFQMKISVESTEERQAIIFICQGLKTNN